MRFNPFSDSSDNEILQQFKNGSKAAFEEIYHRNSKGLYKHALAMLDDEDEAKDMLQELFTSFWIKGKELELKTSLKTYFHSALKNRILNRIEHDRVRANYLNSLSLFLIDSTIEDKLQEEERIQQIEREIQNLPEKMKEIVELRRSKELSYKEIGEHLGISDKTVKKQISNAIKILKVRLACVNMPLALFYFSLLPKIK